MKTAIVGLVGFVLGYAARAQDIQVLVVAGLSALTGVMLMIAIILAGLALQMADKRS